MSNTTGRREGLAVHLSDDYPREWHEHWALIIDVDGGMAIGRTFVDAIVQRDWEALARCFEPDATFQAVTPNANAFRDRAGREAAARQLQAWFGDADVTELVSCTVEPIEDRIHVGYRIHEHEPDGWYLVEQHAFFTPGTTGIAAMSLVCSGFMRVPA
jgi:SnoaL-like protein